MKINYKNQSGMTPLFIVLIIVVALAIGGAVWYVVSRNKTNDEQQNQDTTEQTTEPTAVSLEGSMFDAIKNGQALTCDWTLDYSGDALVPAGKFYTDGVSNGRSSATFESQDEKYETNTLITADRIYDWDTEGNALLSTVKRADYEGQPAQPLYFAVSGQVDPNANFTFDCLTGDVDPAMFEVAEEYQEQIPSDEQLEQQS